jgi:hypothetical protein
VCAAFQNFHIEIQKRHDWKTAKEFL